MASGDTKTESYLRVAAEGTRADLPSDTCCNTKTQNLILGVAERVMDVEDEVEELKNNPDVADIVATYADLQAYDTSKLTDKDVIRVLADETHSGDSTYYRFSKQSGTFTYIGESKQYTDFVGTDGTSTGTAGLVPAPAATDAGKYLKADGTWDSVQSGPTVVQSTGTSTTSVMSQNAVTSMIYSDPSNQTKIGIGSSANGSYGVAIGKLTIAGNAKAVGIGYKANAQSSDTVAIGEESYVNKQYSVALGAYSSPSRFGEVNIGTNGKNHGYNSTDYRLIGGVHDPVDAHDAATKGYVDSNVAPTMFYAPFDIYQSQSVDVSIYLDESLTQAATGGDFYDAMAKYGQVILCTPPSYADSDYHKIVSVYVHQPYEKSVTAFDSYPPEVYFAVPDGAGFVSARLSFNSADPDDTAFFSYETNTQ